VSNDPHGQPGDGTFHLQETGQVDGSVSSTPVAGAASGAVVSPPSADTLTFGTGAGDSARPPHRSSGGGAKKLLVGGLSAAVVGGIAYGGLAFAGFLNGGGTQPEEVLPADTVAFAKIDLNPSADQKLNAFRLLKKFPSVKVTEDDLKATLFEDAFNDNEHGLTYQADVAPWLGNRVAVAAIPAPGTDDNVTPVLAVEFTDEAKMVAARDDIDAALLKEKQEAMDTADFASGSDPAKARDEFAYAIRDTYVLIGDNQAELDRAAAAETVLADAATFAADKDAIDGDGKVVLAWADLGAAYGLTDKADRAEFEEMFGDSAPAGRVSAAVTVEPDYVQMVGQTRDLQATGLNTTFQSAPGTGLVRGFPADTDAALSATGLGDALVNVWNEIGTTPVLDQLSSQARDMGVRLPDDLGVVFGTEFAVGTQFTTVDGNSVIRANTTNPDRAIEVLVPLLELTGEPDLVVDKVDGGYQAATDRTWAAAEQGTLGEDPIFSAAVADAESANAVLFVNLDSLALAFGDWLDKEERANIAPLQALGVSATGDNTNGEFTLRVTTK
jgi:hypothetical protein